MSTQTISCVLYWTGHLHQYFVINREREAMNTSTYIMKRGDPTDYSVHFVYVIFYLIKY